MKILVLGAGLAGITSAWYLRKAGYDVCVVDRQPAVGLETSFANGGQISISHSVPWANPKCLSQLVRWSSQKKSPFFLHWQKLLPGFGQKSEWSILSRWGLKFLRECSTSHYHSNIESLVQLATHSHQQLRQLRQELDLKYDQSTRGILHVYTNSQELAASQKVAQTMRNAGLGRQEISVEQCIEIEPALTASKKYLVGSDYTPSDESGDAFLFCQQLARYARDKGVSFHYDSRVCKLITNNHQINGVLLDTGEILKADAYVVAAGSYSALLLYPLGIRLPVIPVKGYSVTLQLVKDTIAPIIGLIDDEYKIVVSRLGQRLRIAGTAEVGSGYTQSIDNPISRYRISLLLRRVRQLFPQLRHEGKPEFWSGLRPTTPSGLPLIGQNQYTKPFSNLWLNTGHGTLGWTLACGSAQQLCSMISQRSK